ncbi:hypothetical protein Daura_30485 [Dactylosporangium aurantiacum]|uniref:Uncharacterized protein n=1 Tax=Dactylosporangium aurantiacum TaxID=35754 RepID=A0A9Q9MIN1_9ACTN|nr:hypothetical protein [Dactylosporangium aurantiacum]MDG6108726.1 hypothetical protein [Dactylosporangium aurantiacum]UWZ51087.1 hypothetical protein Daura_30485 [Dactylosporangium aurantiacum]
MTTKHSLRGLLHRATHRMPGVPAHAERPAGHHGRSHPPAGVTQHPSPGHGRNHSPAHPPRFLPAWQRRVAAFFGRGLR